jgi:hypothetical protein
MLHRSESPKHSKKRVSAKDKKKEKERHKRRRSSSSSADSSSSALSDSSDSSRWTLFPLLWIAATWSSFHLPVSSPVVSHS